MRTKIEKETVILFNEAEQTADVYTHNAKWKSKLLEMSKEYPQVCIFQEENTDGGVSYRVDKGMISLRKPYSEERKEKDRERAIRENRIGNCRK